MSTQKNKESRGFEFPAGTLERMEAARKRHGERSINSLLGAIVLPWLDADEAPVREKRKAVKP